MGELSVAFKSPWILLLTTAVLVVYCDNGCCGSSQFATCCDEDMTTWIAVGTSMGILILAGVFIFLIICYFTHRKHRRVRTVDPSSEMTYVTQQQVDMPYYIQQQQYPPPHPYPSAPSYGGPPVGSQRSRNQQFHPCNPPEQPEGLHGAPPRSVGLPGNHTVV